MLDVRFYEDLCVKPVVLMVGVTMPHGGLGVGWQSCAVELLSAQQRDPRSGSSTRSSQGSNQLLSVQGLVCPHHMQHARIALGLTPVADAPNLN